MSGIGVWVNDLEQLPRSVRTFPVGVTPITNLGALRSATWNLLERHKALGHHKLECHPSPLPADPRPFLLLERKTSTA